MLQNRPEVFGLLGYPLGHSLSPAMHNAAFHALGVEAEYKLFAVKPDEADSFLKDLSRQNISGLNVTIPYKEKALGFVSLDRSNVFLKQVGAINTIAFAEGSWKGYNTDIPGFARHLKENIDPAGKKVALLGAGGAARAVSYVLAQEKAQEIFVFDIAGEKTKSIVTMVKELFPGFSVRAADSIEQLDIRNKDILINATPVGLRPDDSLPVAPELLHKGLFVYDLIYNPQQTKLLSTAEKSGAKTANGLSMLLYQGMLSFEIWTGKKAPEQVMRQALQKASVKY